MKTNGYIIHEDAYRVIIATGFSRKSQNRKTGNMIQIWILVRSEDPIAAVQSGRDRLICGNCPLRARKATKTRKGKKRACYVNVGQAPRGVWVKWRAGSYPSLPTVEVFRGRTVRFGSYGDPTHLPFALAQAYCLRLVWLDWLHAPVEKAFKSAMEVFDHGERGKRIRRSASAGHGLAHVPSRSRKPSHPCINPLPLGAWRAVCRL